MLSSITFLNATSLLGIVPSYSVKHTNVTSFLAALSKPSNSSIQNALVISLALSGRKLKNTTESLSETVATGAPFSTITVGTTNSSVTSLAYESAIAVTGHCASSPMPSVIALYAFSTLSHLLSLSIA